MTAGEDCSGNCLRRDCTRLSRLSGGIVLASISNIALSIRTVTHKTLENILLMGQESMQSIVHSVLSSSSSDGSGGSSAA